VIRSASYVKLTPYEQKLLIDLLAQYKGDNNGDLCAAWTIMKRRGWRSKSTLAKAITGLLKAEWIELSRQGGRNRPNLYAVTFFAVDDCKGKLDIRPTIRPKSLWRQHEPETSVPLKPDRLPHRAA